MRHGQIIPNLDHLLDLLEFGKDCVQNKDHHPEGNVLNHSIQVFNIAMKEIELIPNNYMRRLNVAIAALLHDIGKISKPHGHEAIGAELIKDFVNKKTYLLVKNHMRFWNYQLGEMKKYSKLFDILNDYDCQFFELSLLARWDKMGRDPNKKIKYDREKIIDQLTSLL